MIILCRMVVGVSFSTEAFLCCCSANISQLLATVFFLKLLKRKKKVLPDKQQFLLYWGRVHILPVLFMKSNFFRLLKPECQRAQLGILPCPHTDNRIPYSSRRRTDSTSAPFRTAPAHFCCFQRAPGSFSLWETTSPLR